MRKKLFTLIILLFLTLSTTFFAVKVEANSNYKDLTTTKLIYQRVGYSNLKINLGVDGNDIALLYQGEKRTFDKGFTAHADAEVVYAFDFPNEITNNFQEFRAYVGNSFYTRNNGDGIIIKIFSGKRKLNKDYNDRGSYYWFPEYESKKAVKGTDEAELVKISLNDRHALKFVVQRVGNISADHGTIADPILCQPDYVEETNSVINNKTFYEEKIKNFDYQNQDILMIQKDLYHYYLIKNIGFYDLNRFANKSEEHKAFLNYLLNDKEFLSLFVLGGKPQNNNYLKVLEILKNLYTKHSTDLTDDTIYPETNIKKSTLAKKMMISIALVNETPVQGMFGDLVRENEFGSKPESNPVLRYEIYKFLRDNKAPAEENGHNYLDVKVFDNLPVEYMRWVFDTEMMDDEIKWLNYWARKKQGFRENDFSSGGYAFIRYTDGNDHAKFVKEKRIALPGDPIGEENFKIYEQKWELDKFGIKNDKHVRIWVIHESGQVCGGISKHGSAMLSSVGRPANVVGQPGHGAYINYYFDNNINDFKWRIDTDISGIWESERWQRMPLDIRHTSRIHHISYNMPHLYLTQAILKDYDNYEKAFLLDILASANGDNKTTEIDIYDTIRQIQPLNFLATIKLIDALNENGELNDFNTTKELFELLIEDYILYPMAIRDFYFLFSKYTKDAVNRQEIINMYNKTLSRIINNTPNTFMYKNEVIKTAQYYLGKTHDFATFSFSGEKANKIVLDSQYQNISIKVRYSLDNKQTFKIVDNTTEITLTEEELAILNSEHGIYVGLVGTDKLHHITIQKGVLNQSDFVINPIKKIVESKNNNLEWSNDNINFTIPNTGFNLDENKTIYFRLKRYDKKDYSNVIEVNYVIDNEFNYIDNTQVEIVELLEGQRDHEKEKLNDGLLLTHYHTQKKSNQAKKIVFKFQEAKKIDKIIYYPRYDIPERFSQIKEFSVFYKTSETSEYNKIGDYVIEEIEKPFEILTKLENVLYVKFEVSKSTHHEAGNNFYIASSEIAFLNKVNQALEPNPVEIVTYYDENGVEILHQIEKGNEHPTAKEGFEWIAVPNEVNKFGLIKSDILTAIQVFESYTFDNKNANETITIPQVFNFEIKELNTSLLNIENNNISLKNKNITENLNVQIEFKLINPYILNKVFTKNITFLANVVEEFVQYYDENYSKLLHTIKKGTTIPTPKSGYQWIAVPNEVNKFGLIRSEILLAIPLFGSINLPSKKASETINIPAGFNIEIKEISTNLLNIQNKSISLKNKNISENVTIQVEIKLINPYILNKVFTKNITFLADTVVEEEFIEYYDEKATLLLHKIKKTSPKPEPREGYEWIGFPNQTNKFGLIKKDVLRSIQEFENYVFNNKKSSETIKLSLGFEFEVKEINTNLLNIEEKYISLKNKEINENINVQIEIKVINPYVIGKVFNKNITFTVNEVEEYEEYYDENGIELLSRNKKGSEKPTPRVGFRWIEIPNQVNKFALIKIDILESIQNFENYNFNTKKASDTVNVEAGFEFEVKEVGTNLLNIDGKTISLKNKKISENITLQIEIKVINRYILNKTYRKMITFSPDKIEEVIEFYDEKGNISKSILKKEEFKKPELDSNYIWFELTNSKFQKVLKEKYDAYLNFKKIETFKSYKINSVIDLEKEIGFNFTIKNSNVKYQDKKLIIEGVEPGKTISIEFVVQEGLIKETIKKDVLISGSKIDVKTSSVNYLIIIGLSLFSLLGLILVSLPMIIVKKIKGSKKR